jgi:hypothetical protein
MLQSSLLIGTKAPADSAALSGWVERIRSRITVLNKQINSLETEKHVLLLKLHESGNSEIEFEIDVEEATPNHDIGDSPKSVLPVDFEMCKAVDVRRDSRKSEQGGLSVVDLLSDEECPNKFQGSALSIETIGALPPNEESVTPLISSNCRISIDEELLRDLDPRELSYDLGDAITRLDAENAPSPNHSLTSDHGECDMKRHCNANRIENPITQYKRIDWANMPLTDLRKWIQFFGMKQNIGGRQVMIRELIKIFSYLASSETVDECRPPVSPVRPQCSITSSVSPTRPREDLHRLFHSKIVTNTILHEKILCFESVDITEIHEFMKSSLTTHSFSIKAVKEFLDFSRIQYSTTNENPARHSRKKRSKKAQPAERDRQRATLRKSISCPPDM